MAGSNRNSQRGTFERYQRSEQALVASLAEMYVQGVSTQKMKAIAEELCGDSFLALKISAIDKRLDDGLADFAERPPAEPFPFHVLDARYEKLREADVVIEPSCADRDRASIGTGAARSLPSTRPIAKAYRPDHVSKVGMARHGDRGFHGADRRRKWTADLAPQLSRRIMQAWAALAMLRTGMD